MVFIGQGNHVFRRESHRFALLKIFLNAFSSKTEVHLAFQLISQLICPVESTGPSHVLSMETGKQSGKVVLSYDRHQNQLQNQGKPPGPKSSEQDQLFNYPRVIERKFPKRRDFQHKQG